MKIRVDATPLRETSWSGHLLRFVAGGLVTVATGLVAKVSGPRVGGLFLAFPAIFPIGVAMIERLQNRQAGPNARGDRARRAAIADAAGTAAGTVGLVTFAVVIWLGLDRLHLALVFAAATAAWATAALISWTVRRPLLRVIPFPRRERSTLRN